MTKRNRRLGGVVWNTVWCISKLQIDLIYNLLQLTMFVNLLLQIYFKHPSTFLHITGDGHNASPRQPGAGGGLSNAACPSSDLSLTPFQ